jgi:glycosyltransferase involved in cell wall biosynthesis
MRGGYDEIPPDALVKLTNHLQQEWRRNVGAASFDHIVDFSGYSPAWSFLLGNASARHRSIWQHNDLLADQVREIHGRRPHEANLRGVFTSYRLFDHLVSVSDALRDVNARNLDRYAPADRFVAARNTIDVQKILSGAAEDVPAGTLDTLLPVTGSSEGHYLFVTVGRLSPEKNHVRLIEAFARVQELHPQARLIIIGDGPLREKLRALVSGLGLEGIVSLLGLQRNPWSIMAKCSTFVLSSDYEGQPMVILEARTLGLGVVSTAFDSVASALEPGAGIVVERSVDALTVGLIEALSGRVPRTPFDPLEYNEKVVKEFERAIGAE